MQRSQLLKISWILLVPFFAESPANPLDPQAVTHQEAASRIFNSVVFYDDQGAPWTLPMWVKTHKKPVLLIAWATWCGPCIQEMPSLKNLHHKMLGRLDVCPISIEAFSDGEKKSNKKKFGMPLFHSDNLSALLRGLGIHAVPAMLLFSPSGILLSHGIGAKKWDSPVEVRALEEKIKPFVPSVHSGKSPMVKPKKLGFRIQ